MHLISIIIFLALLTGAASAETLNGIVVDATTGNPVEGVHIVVEGGAEGTITGYDGRFTLDIVEGGGALQVTASHITYRTLTREVTSPGIFQRIELIPAERTLPQVVVTAGRGAAGSAPASLSNLDRQAVELHYGAQDVPLLVASAVPSATSFSWSGGMVGAQHLRIRGFDTDRLSVTVEGVPLNDPGEHLVYWQDTPDFLSSVYDVQIERGVSNFRAGPAGLGGGVSLSTGDVVASRVLELTYQSGTYNTERRTFLYRSGLVDQRYNFTGRFSRLTTNGYRDHTAADMWAYFLAATRYDPNMVTRFQTWGGQEDMEAYWWGVDAATLKANRKANYSAWDKPYHAQFFGDPAVNYTGEKDWFQQPHYVLRNQWRISPRVELDQSLFYIHGFGYYEEYKVGRRFSLYNLPNVVRDTDGNGTPDTLTRSDLVHRKYVTKDQVGWMPKLKLHGAATDYELGLEVRHYAMDHHGNVIWVNEMQGGAPPHHTWYEWSATKDYLGIYGTIEHRLNERLMLNGGLQVRSVSFPWERRALGAFSAVDFKVEYLFINPRFGATYQIDPRTSLYLSLAGTSREPNEEMIFNADNPNDIPKSQKYGQKELEAERVLDLELGGRRQLGSVDIGLNFYAMFFTNEITPSGNVDGNTGEMIPIQAPASRRIGLELDGSYRTPLKGLTLAGNVGLGSATLGDFKFHHLAYDANWNLVADTTLDLGGNRPALFPTVTANLQALLDRDPVSLSLQVQHVGEQFMDNREDDAAKLKAYTLLDGAIRCRLKPRSVMASLDIELRVRNLGGVLYEPFGVVDAEYGTPYYVPAAGREWLGGITLRL
ncbi:MAG: TonB-dependent receptor [Calditrichaeota bacterium]|nr:TonB-dependent receptor [Calditrichota bacterium]